MVLIVWFCCTYTSNAFHRIFTLNQYKFCSLQGLQRPESADSVDETEAIVLATQWRRRFNRHRLQEQSLTPTDRLGLRRVDRNQREPALSQLLSHNVA